ncbi:MAG: phenylphosphate carboxylase subunit delta [Desulfovibrionaceae bacterium]|nr:phenylphosphate carboxylase subunit delta [Desulfovibrionaceae bacterium]
MPGGIPGAVPPGALCRPGAAEAAARVRFLVLDVDGVCTDGRLYFDASGTASKAFYARDGIGIKTALRAGLGIGIITGRDDPCVRARMTQLGVTEYHPGHEAKLPVLDEIRRRLGLGFDQMAYMGDDWIDLDPLRTVGMPLAVADAAPDVRDEALYVTAAPGGRGAVREAVEFLLNARQDGLKPAALWTTLPAGARKKA